MASENYRWVPDNPPKKGNTTFDGTKLGKIIDSSALLATAADSRNDCIATFAVLIAAVDLLPVLGVGTVLIPWGIFALLAGNTGRGAGLLVLYGVMSVIRQIAEPHLLGKSKEDVWRSAA